MNDILSLQAFDDSLNEIYEAGYHDGVFSKEKSYSDQFEKLRETLLKHNAALMARLTPEEQIKLS
jgi:hypothetical protein